MRREYRALFHAGGHAALRPELIFQVYKDEFDVAFDEGGLFVLTMHRHIIGHRSCISRLDKLITYIKTKPGV